MNRLVFYIECATCLRTNTKYFSDVIVNDFTSLKCDYCGAVFTDDKILHSITINRIGLNSVMKKPSSHSNLNY